MNKQILVCKTLHNSILDKRQEKENVLLPTKL